jgi:hypothetical protein
MSYLNSLFDFVYSAPFLFIRLVPLNLSCFLSFHSSHFLSFFLFQLNHLHSSHLVLIVELGEVQGAVPCSAVHYVCVRVCSVYDLFVWCVCGDGVCVYPYLPVSLCVTALHGICLCLFMSLHITLLHFIFPFIFLGH